ncbi:MAG: hypothetical protein FWG53_04275 [Clostridiales bacterium]|nr:hypothetical protein [Clostridiales bacterium]
MRERSAASGSGMFLTELILAILIFAVASAICLRIFVAAHQISSESSRLNHAVSSAQDCAECFKASGGDLQDTAALLGGALAGGGSAVEVRFDSDWRILPESEPSFFYTASIERLPEKNGCIDANVTVADANGTVIFAIPVSALPGQGALL